MHDKSHQQHRDNHLWKREQEKATLYKLKRLHCPCSKCKGQVQRLLAKIKDDLIHFGRQSSKFWRSLGARDACNDE